MPQISVVEASAGSGKTYALAKRYLRLLMDPSFSAHDPLVFKAILAITFSNKATVEMKTRIFEYLKKIALNRFDSAEEEARLLGDLNVSVDQARLKAHALLEGLIRNYNFFQVKTIDSFINAILSGCALRLERSASFKIRKDYQEYLSFGLDEIIDSARNDQQTKDLLGQFLRQYLILENKSGWFPRKNILEAMSELFKSSNYFSGSYLLSGASIEQALEKKKKITALIRSLAQDLPEATHKSFVNSLIKFCSTSRDIFDWEDISDFFLRDQFPLNKAGRLPSKVSRRWDMIRQSLRESAELEASLVFDCYIRLFDLVRAQFNAFSRKEDVMFLEELNSKARSLLCGGDLSVPELYYRLAARFRHFLIDEFQDTSRLQWENIFPMVEEALSTGGSLFYVGDKKQAIYRFRGGDVDLFEEIGQRFTDHACERHILKENFRSLPEIVSFVNEIFSQDRLNIFLAALREKEKKGDCWMSSQEQTEVLSVFANAHQVAAVSQKGGRVTVHPFECGDREERNAWIREALLALIGDLKGRGYAWGDIALLARENDDVEYLAACLLQENIPVESDKTQNIRNNSFIKELISFLRFLYSPIDDLAFASFITGDIFSQGSGLSPESLREFLFVSHKKKLSKEGVYLYRSFKKIFSEEWDGFIEEFFRGVGFLPVYELTVSILRRFDCLRRFPGEQAFFMKFLELVKDREEESFSLGSFLEYFDKAPEQDLYVRVAEVDAVKVMTFHKAKGLEFRLVLVPFLEIKPRVEADMILPAGDHLVLLRLSEKYRRFSDKLASLYGSQYRRSLVDELNNIYVALTRASEELHIFIPSKVSRGPNLALDLFGSEKVSRGLQPRLQEARQKSILPTSAWRLPSPVYRDWNSFLKEEFVREDPFAGLRLREKGEAVHFLLSCLGNLAFEDTAAAIEKALGRLDKTLFSQGALDDQRKTLLRIVGSEFLRPFFFVERGDVFCELEVVDHQGKTRRMDRVVVLEKEVVVIDYKSSKAAQKEQLSQVRDYVKILTSLYPDKPARGILFFIDTFKGEEIA